MFVRVSALGSLVQRAHGRARHAAAVLAPVLAVASLSNLAHARAPEPQTPGNGQPSPAPGSAAPGTPPPQSYPPQGYPAQPGYPPSSAPQGQPAPQAPNDGQPGYGQPGYGQPGYGQGYAQQPPYGYNEPPLPPAPPKRVELQWSIRFQLLNLLWGRVTGEVEYAFAGPFSVTLLPEYTFNEPYTNRPDGVMGKGPGIAAQFGYWVEGRPLRGYFLKAHAGYRSIDVTGPYDHITVPATELGAMFGSQSVYGGWFTLSGGIGVVYDFQSQDRTFIVGYDSSNRPVAGVLQASGLFGNGFDLLGQISIGGSF